MSTGDRWKNAIYDKFYYNGGIEYNPITFQPAKHYTNYKYYGNISNYRKYENLDAIEPLTDWVRLISTGNSKAYYESKATGSPKQWQEIINSMLDFNEKYDEETEKGMINEFEKFWILASENSTYVPTYVPPTDIPPTDITPDLDTQPTYKQVDGMPNSDKVKIYDVDIPSSIQSGQVFMMTIGNERVTVPYPKEPNTNSVARGDAEQLEPNSEGVAGEGERGPRKTLRVSVPSPNQMPGVYNVTIPQGIRPLELFKVSLDENGNRRELFVTCPFRTPPGTVVRITPPPLDTPSADTPSAPSIDKKNIENINNSDLSKICGLFEEYLKNKAMKFFNEQPAVVATPEVLAFVEVIPHYKPHDARASLKLESDYCENLDPETKYYDKCRELRKWKRYTEIYKEKWEQDTKNANKEFVTEQIIRLTPNLNLAKQLQPPTVFERMKGFLKKGGKTRRRSKRKTKRNKKTLLSRKRLRR